MTLLYWAFIFFCILILILGSFILVVATVESFNKRRKEHFYGSYIRRDMLNNAIKASQNGVISPNDARSYVGLPNNKRGEEPDDN